MIKKLAAKKERGFDWIDLTNPTTDEIHRIAEEYHLHEASVLDCMQPDHLPKYETLENYTFVIIRVLTPDPDPDADTIQELTTKIAFFYTKEYMITVHRREQPLIEEIKTKKIDTSACKDPLQLLNALIRSSLLTFEKPGLKLAEQLDKFEELVFLKNHKAPLLRDMYLVKRKVDTLKRLLILSHDIVDRIDAREHRNVFTRDMRDLYVRMQSVYDNLSENMAQLLSVYFSMASHRTNEIMKVLTIFSVFFMPLTFVVGIYGMNFKYMPELEWHWGYPASLLLMLLIVLLIYVWFKRKKWL